MAKFRMKCRPVIMAQTDSRKRKKRASALTCNGFFDYSRRRSKVIGEQYLATFIIRRCIYAYRRSKLATDSCVRPALGISIYNVIKIDRYEAKARKLRRSLARLDAPRNNRSLPL